MEDDVNGDRFHVFSREDRQEDEFQRVLRIAESLRDNLDTAETRVRIAKVNALGIPSQAVQACIVDHALSLGFQSEKMGLFESYITAHLRPDYYLKLSEGRGVILEVERGKTTANNMDLLDIWKCHICHDAQYLFMMVPMLRPDKNGKMQKIYTKVVERMDPFFRKDNYVSVYGLFLFGY